VTDFKDDIRDRLPKPAASRNGSALHSLAAAPLHWQSRAIGPARLSAWCSIRSRRRHDPHPNPALPPARSVIDEECDYILNLGIEFHGERIDSLKARCRRLGRVRQPGAPRERDLDIPGRKEASANILGIGGFPQSFGHITKIGKRVIVLGGGNAAMDCCRSSRLAATRKKVVVRSGFEEMKASPGKGGRHTRTSRSSTSSCRKSSRTRAATSRVSSSKVKAGDAKGRRNLVPPGARPAHHDDVLVAVGQENAFPGSSATSASSSKWDAQVDPKTMASTHPKVFFGGDAFGPKNIIWAVAHGHDAALDPQHVLGRRRQRPPVADGRDRQSKMHPRVELR
jgi:NADPH-dependent glutamate synthase beta subunit-like oxidoreductase